MEAAASDFLLSDQSLTLVKEQSPGWRTITFRMPTEHDRVITFNTDTGNGGRPQSRSQITVDRRVGKVLCVENFGAYNLGRKLRSIAGFLHTSEILGLPGQIIATLASLGGALLVWTGLALALRRLADWKARRARGKSSAKTAESLSV